MKRKMKTLGIILIVAAAIFLVFIVLFLIFTKNTQTDVPGTEYEPDVVSLYYYYGGGEYGESKSISLKDFHFDYNIDGGTVGESQNISTSFMIGDYNNLDEIIEKYGVKEWSDLPDNEITVLDGATTSVNIEFRDGTTVNLGDSYEMPENGWKAVNEIVNLFESCLEADE